MPEIISRRIDVDGVPVEITEDFDGAVTLLAEFTGTPLGHPIRTLNLPPVTVLGQNRLAYSWTGQVIVKNLVYYYGDAFIDIPSINPFVVKGSGGGNGKIISLVPIPLRVNPVQGEGHDGQYVGGDGGLRPGRVNLAGGYIFDIIPVRDIVILSRWNPWVHRRELQLSEEPPHGLKQFPRFRWWA